VFLDRLSVASLQDRLAALADPRPGHRAQMVLRLLSNRIFKSYDDLVDHCCEAWNKLVDQPWRIMSIGLCQWAHEF
jgi:hypothetical protein